MKYLFLAALLFFSVAHAQELQDKTIPSQAQTLVGSVDAEPPKQYPAMHPAAAAEQPSIAAPVAPVTVSYAQRDWSDIEVYLTFGILGFTLIVLGMLVYLAGKAEKAWSPQSIVRVFGITIIIPMAVLLIVAGYSEKQIASVVGLLGVVAGYLLGNSDRPRTGA